MNPTRILELANAFWGSAALLAANECGLFAALARGSMTIDTLVGATELPERSLRNLADACVALGLLCKSGDLYENSPEAHAFLVPDRKGSLAGALRYNAGLFPAWGQLAEAVRNDKPVVESPTYLGKDEARTRAFVMGMHQRALGMGHAIVGSLQLENAKRLLDVGGGPGTFSALLCQHYPALTSTVFELPAIAAVGRELISDAGLAGRVQFHDGDAFADYLGKNYDAALVSGLLHREPADVCAQFCRRLFETLEPGATVYVVDVMRDDGRVGPSFAALFALNMMLTSERGGCHADVQHVEWLAGAGFTNCEVIRLPAPMVHTIVKATR